MKTLAEFYGKEIKRGELGIELEMEAKKELPDIKEKNWESCVDQSLRGFSKEYTTSMPIVVSTLGATLDVLFERVKASEPKESFRTSSHVHKNVLKYSPVQIWNAACAYWIMEDVLYGYCGEDRIFNTFCARLANAEGLIDSCAYDLSTDFPFKSFKHNDDIRYAGLNLAAIRKFGSIEFRGMRGVTTSEPIKVWATEMSNLVDRACVQFENPEELLDTFYKEDKEQFLSRFLSYNFTEELFKLSPKWKDMVQDGAERVIPLAYGVTWDKWQKRCEDTLAAKIYKGTISDKVEHQDFADAQPANPAVAARRRMRNIQAFQVLPNIIPD